MSSTEKSYAIYEEQNFSQQAHSVTDLTVEDRLEQIIASDMDKLNNPLTSREEQERILSAFAVRALHI